MLRTPLNIRLMFPVAMKPYNQWHQLLGFLLLTTDWPHRSDGWSIVGKGGLKNEARFSLIFPGMYLKAFLLFYTDRKQASASQEVSADGISQVFISFKYLNIL
jgi:hypothetical protein